MLRILPFFSGSCSKTEVSEQLYYKKYGFGLWAAIHKKTNDLLGQCGLTIQDCNGEKYLEIGYSFKKKHWHNGYAVEAAAACKKYAFEILKVEKVCSIIRENNIASQNVAKRIGMQKAGEIMKHYYNMDMLHYIFEIKNYGKYESNTGQQCKEL